MAVFLSFAAGGGPAAGDSNGGWWAAAGGADAASGRISPRPAGAAIYFAAGGPLVTAACGHAGRYGDGGCNHHQASASPRGREIRQNSVVRRSESLLQAMDDIERAALTPE